MKYPEILKFIPENQLVEWARVNGYDVKDLSKLWTDWTHQNNSTDILSLTDKIID